MIDFYYLTCVKLMIQFHSLSERCNLVFLFVFQDGCIVCPSTDSTFDLRTGEIKEWYPKNPVLRALTPALRKLFTYRVKTDDENIYISISGADSAASAEIIFSGKAQPGVTASDVNVEEVPAFPCLFMHSYFNAIFRQVSSVVDSFISHSLQSDPLRSK
jgi:hypothetical protein